MYEAYPLQSQIAQKIASQYQLSPNGTRASIVIYSNNAQIELLLKDGTSQQAFQQKLDNLPFLGLDTRLDRGLYLARLSLFTKKYGARAKVPKILYIFIDGEQSTLDNAALNAQAEELRKLGVQVVIMGVGGAVDRKELEAVAYPNDKVYYAASFHDLLNNDPLIKGMVNRTYLNLRKSDINPILPQS